MEFIMKNKDQVDYLNKLKEEIIKYPIQIGFEKTHYNALLNKEKESKEKLKTLPNIINATKWEKLKLKIDIYNVCKREWYLPYIEQKELYLSTEIWETDCLEYNVNEITKYIELNNIAPKRIKAKELQKYVNCDDVDMSKIGMRKERRESLIKNPIIVFDSDFMYQPAILNGNHRILKSCKGNKTLEMYFLNPIEVRECLTTENLRLLFDIQLKCYEKYHIKIGM